MPRYSYRCETCEKTQTIAHKSDEKPGDCVQCGPKGKLIKLMTSFSTLQKNHKTSSTGPIGKVTEDFIKDAREELKLQRQQLDKDRK